MRLPVHRGVSTSGSRGGVCVWIGGPLGHIPPRHTPPRTRSTSGRYASYWNAFLLHLQKYVCPNKERFYCKRNFILKFCPVFFQYWSATKTLTLTWDIKKHRALHTCPGSRPTQPVGVVLPTQPSATTPTATTKWSVPDLSSNLQFLILHRRKRFFPKRSWIIPLGEFFRKAEIESL